VNGLNLKVSYAHNLVFSRGVRLLNIRIRNWMETKPLGKLPVKQRMFCTCVEHQNGRGSVNSCFYQKATVNVMRLRIGGLEDNSP